MLNVEWNLPTGTAQSKHCGGRFPFIIAVAVYGTQYWVIE